MHPGLALKRAAEGCIKALQLRPRSLQAKTKVTAGQKDGQGTGNLWKPSFISRSALGRYFRKQNLLFITGFSSNPCKVGMFPRRFPGSSLCPVPKQTFVQYERVGTGDAKRSARIFARSAFAIQRVLAVPSGGPGTSLGAFGAPLPNLFLDQFWGHFLVSPHWFLLLSAPQK